MTIHLIVRYRERQANDPTQQTESAVEETMNFMMKPCFYATLTTVTAFASLLVSGIRPVIDFGYMMTLGVSFAFILIFLLFPSILLLISRGDSPKEVDFTSRLTLFFARIVCKGYDMILVAAAIIAFVSILGIYQLQVENRFIDYFKEHTEIYQGMLTIDRKLGGTTPLDFILRPPKDICTNTSPSANCTTISDDPLDEDLGGYFDDVPEEASENSNYWLTPLRFEEIKKLHDYFESQPEIGKVLSLATLIRLSEQLNKGQPLLDLEATLLPKFFT